MSGTVPGAALPWAAPEAAANAEQQLSQQEQALPVEALGLAIGGRIEVRWEIHPEDDDKEPFAKWWGARIASQAEAPRQAQAEGAAAPGPCYVLAYDPDEGFEAEERTVQLTSEHELLDLEDGDSLSWRREGESWEPPETATLGEVLRSLPDERELREAEEEVLSDLDPATQRRLAAGFRDWAESLKDYIKDKLETAAAAGQADQFVVTEGMIAEFKAAHGARAARDQAHGA